MWVNVRTTCMQEVVPNVRTTCMQEAVLTFGGLSRNELAEEAFLAKRCVGNWNRNPNTANVQRLNLDLYVWRLNLDLYPETSRLEHRGKRAMS